jgi:hypothetical protein
MPRVLGGPWGGGRFLMGEVTLYSHTEAVAPPHPTRGITLLRRHQLPWVHRRALQGYLAHKNQRPPRILQLDHA